MMMYFVSQQSFLFGLCKGDPVLTTTKVLMLIDDNYLLETLGEKASLSPMEEDSSQHTYFKLDDTHSTMHDNKAIRQMQPTT